MIDAMEAENGGTLYTNEIYKNVQRKNEDREKKAEEDKILAIVRQNQRWR